MTTDGPRSPASLQALWSAPAPAVEPPTFRGRPMPEALEARYGGPLEIAIRPDRPTLLVNFVSTIDGSSPSDLVRRSAGE